MKSFRSWLGNPHLGEQGQSLVQVMVSAAVMAVIMMGFVSMQESQQKANLGAQTALSRNMLQMQIQQALSSTGAMAKTLADTSSGNVALKNCLEPSGNSCNAVTGAGFKLHDGLGNIITGDGSSSTQVLRFDFQGAVCNTASPQCIFEVFAQYTSTCPSGSPCSNPTVTAAYTIQQAPGMTAAGGSMLRPVISPPITISATGSGFTVSSTYTTGGSLGAHSACFLTKTVVTGVGSPGCVLAGASGSSWSLTINGGASCEAICLN